MNEVFSYSSLANFFKLEPNEQKVHILPRYSGAVSKIVIDICNIGILAVHIWCSDITVRYISSFASDCPEIFGVLSLVS
jgi:hypothetical protein